MMYSRKKTFQLLPFSLHLEKALALLALSLLAACSFNPRVQGNGSVALQGEWQQDSIPGGNKLTTYALQRFKFDCDSFYITINTVSKVNYGADSCMNRGRWTEYVKGRYEQQNDTLHLKGYFCNANGSLKDLNTCFRSGIYEETFGITQKGDSLLTLVGRYSALPVNARLIKRTTCSPKAL
jgi:hypothetical protein